VLFFCPLLWYQGERLDLGYNFNTEKTTSGTHQREIAASKKCGYEVFDEPLADGILVSRTLLEQTTNLVKEDDRYVIKTWKKKFYEILSYCSTKGRYIPSFADPGTWSYVNQFKLPDYLYSSRRNAKRTSL